MEIKNLSEDDLPSLAKLYELFRNEQSSVEKMQSTFVRLRDNPNYILLAAKQDGRLIGSVMGVVCDELYGECKPFMVVEDVVVDNNHRRKGAGSLMMKELERRAIEKCCTYIILITEQARKTAHAFYKSLGFDGDVYKGFKKRLV